MLRKVCLFLGVWSASLAVSLTVPIGGSIRNAAHAHARGVFNIETSGVHVFPISRATLLAHNNSVSRRRLLPDTIKTTSHPSSPELLALAQIKQAQILERARAHRNGDPENDKEWLAWAARRLSMPTIPPDLWEVNVMHDTFGIAPVSDALERVRENLRELKERSANGTLDQLSPEDPLYKLVQLFAAMSPDTWDLEMRRFQGLNGLKDPRLAWAFEDLNVQDNVIVEHVFWRQLFQNAFRDAPTLEDGLPKFRAWLSDSKEQLAATFGADLKRVKKYFDTYWLDFNGTIGHPADILHRQRERMFLEAIGALDSDQHSIVVRGERPAQNNNDELNARLVHSMVLTQVDGYLRQLDQQRRPEPGWSAETLPVPDEKVIRDFYVPDAELTAHLTAISEVAGEEIRDVLRTYQDQYEWTEGELDAIAKTLGVRFRVNQLAETPESLANVVRTQRGYREYLEKHYEGYIPSREHDGLDRVVLISGSDANLYLGPFEAEIRRVLAANELANYVKETGDTLHVVLGMGSHSTHARGAIDPLLGHQGFKEKIGPVLRRRFPRLSDEELRELFALDLRQLTWGNVHAILVQPETNSIPGFEKSIDDAREILRLAPADEGLDERTLKRLSAMLIPATAQYHRNKFDFNDRRLQLVLRVLGLMGSTNRLSGNGSGMVIKESDLFISEHDPFVDMSRVGSSNRVLYPRDLADHHSSIDHFSLGLLESKDSMSSHVDELRRVCDEILDRAKLSGRAIPAHIGDVTKMDPVLANLHAVLTNIERMPDITPRELYLVYAFAESYLRRTGWTLLPDNEAGRALVAEMGRGIHRNGDGNRSGAEEAGARRAEAYMHDVTQLRERFGNFDELDPTAEGRQQFREKAEAYVKALIELYAVSAMRDPYRDISITKEVPEVAKALIKLIQIFPP